MRLVRSALLGLGATSWLVLACVPPRLPVLPTPPPEPAATPTPSPTPSAESSFAVRKVDEEVIVAAWSEPRQLPPGGGQAHIIVRLQRRGGRPFPGVEVRLRASRGTLYSGGRILATDARGMTRDRVTSTQATVITLNAGGTRYRFRIPVATAEDAAP